VTRVCPECGARFGDDAEPPPIPQARDGALVEITQESEGTRLRSEVNKLAARLDITTGSRFGSSHAWLKRMVGGGIADRSPEQLRRCLELLNGRLGRQREHAL
jgi:hypothetical protein